MTIRRWTNRGLLTHKGEWKIIIRLDTQGGQTQRGDPHTVGKNIPEGGGRHTCWHGRSQDEGYTTKRHYTVKTNLSSFAFIMLRSIQLTLELDVHVMSH